MSEDDGDESPGSGQIAPGYRDYDEAMAGLDDSSAEESSEATSSASSGSAGITYLTDVGGLAADEDDDSDDEAPPRPTSEERRTLAFQHVEPDEEYKAVRNVIGDPASRGTAALDAVDRMSSEEREHFMQGADRIARGQQFATNEQADAYQTALEAQDGPLGMGKLGIRTEEDYAHEAYMYRVVDDDPSTPPESPADT